MLPGFPLGPDPIGNRLGHVPFAHTSTSCATPQGSQREGGSCGWPRLPSGKQVVKALSRFGRARPHRPEALILLFPDNTAAGSTRCRAKPSAQSAPPPRTLPDLLQKAPRATCTDTTKVHHVAKRAVSLSKLKPHTDCSCFGHHKIARPDLLNCDGAVVTD